MKSDKRSRRGMLAMLTADPYRKLAAIVLAAGLWVWINLQITNTTEITLPLTTISAQADAQSQGNRRVAVVLPTNQVVGKSFYNGDKVIEAVKVTFSGPNYRIRDLEVEILDLRIPTFVGRNWDAAGSTMIEFTADNVQRNQRILQDVSISFDPPRIRLEVERIDATTRKLTLDDVELLQLDTAVKERMRIDTVRFSPESVRIEGPKSSLANFPASGAKPFQAYLPRAAPAALELSAEVTLAAAPELGLSFSQKPTMTIQLSRVTKPYTFELPVLVDDLALPEHLRGLYEPEAPTKNVRVRAGVTFSNALELLESSQGNLREWAKQHLRLEVWIRPLPEGQLYEPIIVEAASLRLRGPLLRTVDPGDCSLAEDQSVTLRRKQQ